MAPLTLLSLPSELLLLLPAHLHNIEDFTSLSSTCRTLHTTLSDTLPKHLLQLAANSAPTFFSPHPAYLTLLVARQLAHWTVAVPSEYPSRVSLLTTAFKSGLPGVLALALSPTVEGVGLTLPALRTMHLARFSTINPLSTTIDAMVGASWYAQPDFWSSASDAFTLYTDASELTFQLLIYAELFAPTMEEYLRPKAERGLGLGPEVRIEFVKYCVPDWVCAPPHRRGDGFEVEASGPYGEGWEGEVRGGQTAMAHLLGGAMFRGSLWRRAWRRVLVEAGAEEEGAEGWPEEWVGEMRKVEWKKREEEKEEGEEGRDESSGGNQVGQSTEAEEEQKEEVEENDGDENDDGDNVEEREEEEEDEGEQEEEQEADDEEQEADTTTNTNPTTTPSPSLNHSLTVPWRYTLFFAALTTTTSLCPSPSSSSPSSLPLSTFTPIARFKGREESRPLTLSPAEKAHILALRDRVLALSDEDAPGWVEVGRRQKARISEAPDLRGEAFWCCAGLWTGF